MKTEYTRCPCPECERDGFYSSKWKQVDTWTLARPSGIIKEFETVVKRSIAERVSLYLYQRFLERRNTHSV